MGACQPVCHLYWRSPGYHAQYDETQSRVVCYSGYTEKQSIQFYDKGKPLYAGNNEINT